MVVANSLDEALPARWRYQRPGEDHGSWCIPYFGTDPLSDSTEGKQLDTLNPQAFQVDFDPGHHTGAHFHLADQFQVFIAGNGSIGKTVVKPVSVHYAGGYSPYGPLVGGPDGLTYYTLRNAYDNGIHFMPQSREKLRAGNRRPRVETVDLDAEVGAPIRLNGQESERTAVMDPDDDGLAVWRYRVAAGQTIDGPTPHGTGGQHWLVLSGSGALGDVPLGRLSCVFLSPDEAQGCMVAGCDGLDLLLLQFPTPMWAIR